MSVCNKWHSFLIPSKPATNFPSSPPFPYPKPYQPHSFHSTLPSLLQMALLSSHFFFFFLFLSTAMSTTAMREAATYELQRGNFYVKLTDLGASLLSLILPDKHGKLDDIVLGYQTVEEYKKGKTYFGAVVGRVANRIGGAQYTFNGVHYKLVPNDGKNMLHGGPLGFSHVMWEVQRYKADSHITFAYTSRDGEEGFPGEVKVSATYMLVGGNKLALRMEARAVNKPTPVSLASHIYWNLGGHGSGDVLSHTIQIFGSRITPVDGELIPTGRIEGVEGTGYDLRRGRRIGEGIKKLGGVGYDINYELDGEGRGGLKAAAVVGEERSGRKMEVWTTEPGVQFYTGNKLGRVQGKEGVNYSDHSGFCLETQQFPDAVNHPNFPSVIVFPGGRPFLSLTLFRFSAS